MGLWKGFNIKKAGIRTAGLVLALGGLWLWWSGDVPMNFTLGPVRVAVPAFLLLVVLGLVLLITPTFLIRVVGLAIKSERGQAIIDKILSELEPPKDPAPTEDSLPIEIVRWTTRGFKERDNRYFATVFVIFLFFLTVLPVGLIITYNSLAYQDTAERFARTIQGNVVEFNSADQFRAALVEVEKATSFIRVSNSATYKSHDLASRLYNPNIESDKMFEDTLSQVYTDEIVSRAGTSRPYLLRSEMAAPCRRSVESQYACASYLTLLAGVASSQGLYGEYIEPYLRARQYALEAIAVGGRQAYLPGAYYLAGISYVAQLRLYEDYTRLFEEYQITTEDIPGITERTPESRARLAQLAMDSYERANRQTASNFNKARYHNNVVDLKLGLIHMAYIDSIDFSPKNEAEGTFIRNATGAGSPGDLSRILRSLDEDIENALTLSTQPEYYFTRGQLFSVTGQLVELGIIEPSDDILATEEYLIRGASNLLQALDMGISPSLFDSSKIADLHLDWLFAKERASNYLRPFIELRKER